MNSNSRINLLMAVHSHQPEGNFEWIFAEGYEKAYLPFLTILHRHPKIKMALHYTGCLLDWFADKHPEFIKMLKELVKRGQVEMLSGGYYEPVFSLIPERDIIGQIRLMNEKVEEFTGYVPSGAWLAERVWEPTLINPMAKAGIKYTIVDDWHFVNAGKKPDELSGYYVTEDEGQKLLIFPGSERLRYSMPFKLPHETINYLRDLKEKGIVAKAFADDGEKFGIWPGTFKWVYEERWLENFFEALEAQAGWLHIMTFCEYIRTYGPTDRVYLSCASYREMMEWSGGYFKNFLVKYPEANSMQKKMLYVSERVAETKPKSKKALCHLYKGQCNCGYWHGIFGGLYLNHLRSAVYSNLIEAEKALDAVTHKGSTWVDVKTFDFDSDTYDEILISSPKLNLYFSPHSGGSLFELDFKPMSLNLTNTLARRKEAYHEKISERTKSNFDASRQSEGIASIHDIADVKYEDLLRDLNYDWYRKVSLLDHFLREGTTVKDFAASRFSEAGDFLNADYDYEIKKSAKPKSLIIKLTRDGNYFCATGENRRIKIVKTITVNSNGSILEIEYEVINLDSKEFSPWFGVEFNYSLKDPHLNRIGEVRGLKNININDQWYGIRIDFEFSSPTSFWYFPIETVSDSEAGLERTYQELSLLFHWNLKLAPKDKWLIRIFKDIKVTQ